ncbi:NTP transferase domain-containing protein [Gemmatimonas sp.]|uniref:nucleotidyltransferase family protein n=1 Tax=Gemmatimonas sp. TaxID=1962908 RepID=UPI0039830245
MTVAGVLLAAGGSRRLGAPKQLLKTNGVTLVERAARQLLDAGCCPVIVVLGANAAEVRDAVSMLTLECVENAHWERGMGTSIALAMTALNAVRFAEVRAALIATCDMPAVTVEHLVALKTASNSCDATSSAVSGTTSGVRRVASSYVGPDGATVRGIPAVLPRADWSALAALDGDEGARAQLRQPDTLTVSLRHGSFDLDTPADVAAWHASEAVSP